MNYLIGDIGNTNIKICKIDNKFKNSDSVNLIPILYRKAAKVIKLEVHIIALICKKTFLCS